MRTPEHLLDFTYLFDERSENPAHATMGKGQRTSGFFV